MSFCALSLYAHEVLSPHNILDNIQARVRNHLDYMPVLSTSDPHASPLCIVVLLLSIYNVLENQVEGALGDRRLRILEEI